MPAANPPRLASWASRSLAKKSCAPSSPAPDGIWGAPPLAPRANIKRLQPANPLKNRSVLFSALAGFTYGLFCRLAFTRDSPLKDLWGVMTIGFLGVMPLAVGFISAFFAVRAGKRGPATWVGLPIVTTVALFAGSFVLFWEGIICLTMLLPLALVMAILGGALGGFCARRFGQTPTWVGLPIVTTVALFAGSFV